MSITNALSNSLSGLNAASRAADVVSANVANAMTEGYGRRDIELSSHVLGRDGAGVQVVGVTRNVDASVIGARRLADASVGLASTRVDFFEQIETAIGLPTEEGSLTAKIALFEGALIEAGSTPDSGARLRSAVDAATTVANHINTVADVISEARTSADAQISSSVDFLNDALKKVVDLNVTIQHAMTSGYDANGLVDQRQVLIDQISEMIPVREMPRSNGMVALYTAGGGMLVDSKAAELGFSRVNTIDPAMTLEGGGLSGLTLNGREISTSATGPISGGILAGLFEIRDILAPQAQAQIDSVARDMIERFEDAGVDPTLASGGPGLFTDNGSALDPANEVGLSNRLSLNSLVVPEEGGALWRLRDGLGATSEGPSGNASLLQAMSDALSQSRQPSSGAFTNLARNAVGFSADMVSDVSSRRLSNESDLGYSAARVDSLRTAELADGVDTDYEMQRLLMIEQAYSANAKVIQTIDTLIKTLLGM
ncbi:Flagellar hook-associated protein 1 [Aquimixticola soesokkakensis]|uniref:Flagellar hook-associated protein 1 n=1 Tax=Aquimixticola soesokkakensis TaxID=1519096 RepID=A0A1Y5RFG7_9RHOB|nr:flagellar hook-associated protein FlgK [Aquimixticola soesokkakensis]SLN13621.1 Flagellar hook-associated protein 1 [Aquimixticola soesokkakensis]